MDTAFKNAVITAFLDAEEYQPFYDSRYPGFVPINIIYGGSMEGSLGRKLVVDIWVQHAHTGWVVHLSEDLAHIFVLEFSRALLISSCKGKDKRLWKERLADYLEA
jgi:hypothetical protein